MAEDRNEADRDRDGSYSGNDWRSRQAMQDAIERAAERAAERGAKRAAEDTARIAADKAVRDTLDQIGVALDGKGKVELSIDLAHLHWHRMRTTTDEEWQKDQAWVRRTRLRSEKDGDTIRSKLLDRTVASIVGAVFVAGCYILAMLGLKGHP